MCDNCVNVKGLDIHRALQVLADAVKNDDGSQRDHLYKVIGELIGLKEIDDGNQDDPELAAEYERRTRNPT